MKAMNYADFYKKMGSMFGSTTCFVTDSPNNRMNYSCGEVDDVLLDKLEGQEITEETLDENSEVAAVMLENFSAEMKPASNIQDDDYMTIIRNCFSINSKLYSAKIGDETTYILYYENGTTQIKGNYKLDSKVGKWEYFKADGTPDGEEIYGEEGSLLKPRDTGLKYYDKNGNEIKF